MIHPLVIFAYNRPELFQQTLNSVSNCIEIKDTDLHIYIDGPKANATNDDKRKIQKVKEIAESFNASKTVSVYQSMENKGLANAIIYGVTEILNKNEAVVILEDDIEVSPFFLAYMNNALNVYKGEKKVLSIGSWNFFGYVPAHSDTFFTQIPDTIGWATWRDRWSLFEPDAEKLAIQIRDRNLESRFNLDGAYDYMGMLKMQADKKISSWGVRWQAVALLENKLCLYPKWSVANHKGFGIGASNTHDVNYGDLSILAESPINVDYLQPVLENQVEDQLKKSYRLLFATDVPKRELNKWSLLKKSSVYNKVALSLRRLYTLLINNFKALSRNKVIGYYFSGPYKSWEDACVESTGYDDEEIITSSIRALKNVLNGVSRYERDGFNVDEIQTSWPLVTTILHSAIKRGNKVHVLDFGGALGSLYFQLKEYLTDIEFLKWSVVEQPSYVKAGLENFVDKRLNFYTQISHCLSDREKPDIIILSGVLQYLDNMDKYLKGIIDLCSDYIIIERTGFVLDSHPLVLIQHIDTENYKASYPVWFFNERLFLDKFLDYYDVLAQYASSAENDLTYRNKQLYWKSFLLKRKKNVDNN